MLLLVTTGHPDMARYAHPNLGRLVQPREVSSIEKTAADGVPWAADNDCFQGLKPAMYTRMLKRISGLAGCLFVTVPDVVADAAATDDLWDEWRSRVDQPAAYVLQDGCRRIPTDADAVFIGGTTEFKLGAEAERWVREAQRRGLWVHMGRVNGHRRIRYAKAIGCDSVDGSSWTRFKTTWLRDGLASVEAPPHLRLELA